MQKCLLCDQADADKKNSHILPLFLIKSAINEEGKTQRDYELVFTISAGDFVDNYFGRNLSPETIERVKGRDLSDEEIENNKNFFVRDNIFCTNCEKRLSELESYIAEKFYNDLLANKAFPSIQDSKGNEVVTVKYIEPRLYSLFVYSIFWRCSIVNFSSFKLDNKIESLLKITLNRYLATDIKEVINSVKEAEVFLEFPLISTFNDLALIEDPTTNFISVSHSKMPYFIFANNMSFQLFAKLSHVKASNEYLRGLSEMISKKEALFYNSQELNITLLTSEQTKTLQHNYFRELARRALNFYRKTFLLLHGKLFSHKCPSDLLNKFTYELINGEAAFADRYTRKHFAQCAFEAIIKFYKLKKAK